MSTLNPRESEREAKTAKTRTVEKFRICSQDDFRIVLERERSRADRNNHLLTLIIFNIGENNQSKSVMNIKSVLTKRARGIDRFGWFDDYQIGILLPNTSFEGGKKFAYDICQMVINEKHKPPGYKIYTYPTRWITSKSQKTAKSKDEIKTPRYIEGIDLIFARKMKKWKRMLDVIGTVILLMVFSPIFLLVPLIVKLVAPGPVFYKQERVGHGGRIFTLLKFRTMKVSTDVQVHQNHLYELIKSDQPMTKLDKRDDPRIIPFGKILRKTCLDEVPQLINVLKGDMSLVGPRPCLPYEAQEYLKLHQYRFDIYPGMTGLWQVSGKNRLSFKEMIRYDIIYAKKMGFWLDVRILIKTVPTVFSIIIDKIKIDSFFENVQKNQVPEAQFKEFIRRYYSDIYNVDKLEFIDNKLKDYQLDLMDLMLLLSKLHNLNPTYNVAKRYFGICKLIDTEKKSQLKSV